MFQDISEACVDHLKWCFDNKLTIKYADILPGLLYDEWVIMSLSKSEEGEIGKNSFYLIQYDKHGISFIKQFDFFGDCSKLAWFYTKDQDNFTGMSAYLLWSGEWNNLNTEEWVQLEKAGWCVDALINRLSDDNGMPHEELRK